MNKINGKLLYSIKRLIKKIKKWDIDGSAVERYNNYLFNQFQICSNCNRPLIYHSDTSLPFFWNGTRAIAFCDKKIQDRSLNRIFILDPEATQIIHGVIAVKFGISK